MRSLRLSEVSSSDGIYSNIVLYQRMLIQLIQLEVFRSIFKTTTDKMSKQLQPVTKEHVFNMF